MAFLEWRRFNFFDIVKDVDGGKFKELLEGLKVTATTSGNGFLVLGDSTGNIHVVTRNFNVTTFRGYHRNISLAEMSQELPFLVTIGEDEIGINPLIKVWNIDNEDRQGNPVCVRVSRASLLNRAISTSCLCINSKLTLMAVGFLDGSILLYRGDIKRQRSTKQKLLQEGKQSITGLAFRQTEKYTYLFVVSLISVDLYDITHKDKETKTVLDSVGCSPRCSVLMDSAKDSHFMVCRNDAIYCYTNDGLGPCYAIDGEKVLLRWFRSYLVIVAKESKNKSHNTNTTTAPLGNQGNIVIEPEHHTLTVLDIQNKFIVFSVPIKEVQAVLTEWGSFYIVTDSNAICQLAEKDLQSKLVSLFKKNLYDVSIRIAKSHHYDTEGLVDIFRQYGDHLYSKGDHNGAIEQYIKTIGKLEPSYVIRKFLASHQVDNLTTYLQALHKHGVATADHTTLLLNCYTKLNQVEKLKEFIMTEDRELDFDVEVAINVCRQTSSEDALLLAKKHNLHSWYLKIQIEDKHEYSAALDYVGQLKFSEALENMILYCGILLEKASKETTQFLKMLCTDYKPSNQNTDGLKQEKKEFAPPENFIHLFVNNSECLVDFLEYLVQSWHKWGPLIYNTLVEHYLQIWFKLDDSTKRLYYEQKIIRLLESADCNCDKHLALILCQAVNFRPGLLYLYEENKMYQQILNYHLSQGDYNNVLTCCRRFGNQDSNLWVHVLWSGARDSKIPPFVLTEILTVIEKERLLTPIEVLDAVCSWKTINVGHIRPYLNSILQTELKAADHEQTLIEKYTQETSRMRGVIKNLQNCPVTFQGSRCSACNNQLELPSVHFLCQHSFHQHCFQSFSEQDNECPACLPNNKQILDVIRSQVQNSDLHETFHSQLESAEDGFSLVADYFGRGIFNKFTVINDLNQRSRLFLPKLSEGSIRSNFVTPPPVAVNNKKPERPKELVREKVPVQRYSSMLEANLTRDQHTDLTPNTDSPETPLTAVIVGSQQTPAITSCNNPFENNDDYPRGNNPFENDDDDDDYDRNLNPFSS